MGGSLFTTGFDVCCYYRRVMIGTLVKLGKNPVKLEKPLENDACGGGWHINWRVLVLSLK